MRMCGRVKDGVDLDWEDNAAMEAGLGEDWVITCIKTLRDTLPSSDGFILTGAPQAPYFLNDTSVYSGGGFLRVDREVGDLVDFWNIQFYNQGDSKYDRWPTHSLSPSALAFTKRKNSHT